MSKMTIKEIARLAGVSTSAVSIVLNNRPGVSENTREKVQEIIRQNNYVPNPNSRRLLLDKSDNITVLLAKDRRDLSNQFYVELNNEIGKSERSDARISELNEKVNDLYGKIMADEGMVAYNEAKKDCENLVNYIDAIINTAMNGGDPMTVQEPSASCTGSCSTCGGCH